MQIKRFLGFKFIKQLCLQFSVLFLLNWPLKSAFFLVAYFSFFFILAYFYLISINRRFFVRCFAANLFIWAIILINFFDKEKAFLGFSHQLIVVLTRSSTIFGVVFLIPYALVVMHVLSSPNNSEAGTKNILFNPIGKGLIMGINFLCVYYCCRIIMRTTL